MLKCLIQALDADTPGSLEIQDIYDDTDLAACLQHVADVDSSVGKLDVVQLDAGLIFHCIELTPASEQLDSQLSSVDESRREFCHRDKMMMEVVPPTQGALLQHLNGAVYQTSIWTTADQHQQQAPSPE